MVKKVQRECWSTPTDALDLVSELKDTPGCFVKWETDDLHRLKHVLWSTGQQQVFARQWGGIVIQDNTCLTNRCGLLLSSCPYAAVGGVSSVVYGWSVRRPSRWPLIWSVRPIHDSICDVVVGVGRLGFVQFFGESSTAAQTIPVPISCVQVWHALHALRRSRHGEQNGGLCPGVFLRSVRRHLHVGLEALLHNLRGATGGMRCLSCEHL